MGSSQAIRLGPFTGGMNTASDPTAVADTELVDIVNFELDIDGSYICRPPIFETVNNSGVSTERLVMIGRAILAGVEYVIASNEDGTFAFDGTTWTTILADLESRVALQFQDRLFIVATPSSAVDGGYWNGAAFTTDASMPRGEAAVFHKARLFIAPGVDATGTAAHQLRYTDPISISAPVPLVWPAAGVVSVGQGNGENLVDVVVYNDNLMLFKQDSTYVLAYDTAPADAILRTINNNIGATTRRCVVLYENSVFVYHEGNIFEVVNYDFQRINFKVPFELDGGVPLGADRLEQVFLCTMGDRLIVRYFNKIYVYGLKTRAWTRWEFQDDVFRNFGPLVEMPSNEVLQTLPVYYMGSSLQFFPQILAIQDGHDAVTSESTIPPDPVHFDIECYLLTKNYDLSDSHHYKKLGWWGADILSTRDIEAVVNPITTETAVTWGELSTHHWDDLGTWGAPLATVTFSVTTDIVDTTTVARKFIKLLKALRWRQINFQIKLMSNGTTVDGPCRFFTFTAVVSSKQTVVKQVN